MSRELTRDQAVQLLLEKVGVAIGDRTLLSYEHFTRPLSVNRLLQLAAAYEKPVTVLLADSIRRVGRNPACPLCGHH